MRALRPPGTRRRRKRRRQVKKVQGNEARKNPVQLRGGPRRTKEEKGKGTEESRERKRRKIQDDVSTTAEGNKREKIERVGRHVPD